MDGENQNRDTFMVHQNLKRFSDVKRKKKIVRKYQNDVKEVREIQRRIEKSPEF